MIEGIDDLDLKRRLGHDAVVNGLGSFLMPCSGCYVDDENFHDG